MNKICLDPNEWVTIVEWIKKTPIAFDRAEDAVQVKRAIDSAMGVNINVEGNGGEGQ